MQHALYSTSASRVYVARWALRRNEKRFVDAFAPATFLARALLLALPGSQAVVEHDLSSDGFGVVMGRQQRIWCSSP